MTGGAGPKAIVAGTGFGCRIQVPALRAAGFEVAGLVGSNPERTAERARQNNIPAGFTDLEAALDATGAVAVAVSSPPATHADLVLKAVVRGCHVICEKPMAANAKEAAAMLQAAEAAGVVHYLGNEFRWEAQRALLVRTIQDGLIGEPKFSTFVQYVRFLGHLTLADWWWEASGGGGWLGSSGAHQIDWIRTALGDFRDLSATLQHIDVPADGAEDSFTVRFRMKNGAEGVLQQTASAYGPMTQMVRVAGTKGSVWLESGAVWLADAEGVRELPVPADLVLPPPPQPTGDPRFETAEWKMLVAAELAPYIELARAWRAAMEGRPVEGRVRPATFADGVAAMKVFDAIRASAKAGGAVTAAG